MKGMYQGALMLLCDDGTTSASRVLFRDLPFDDDLQATLYYVAMLPAAVIAGVQLLATMTCPPGSKCMQLSYVLYNTSIGVGPGGSALPGRIVQDRSLECG